MRETDLSLPAIALALGALTLGALAVFASVTPTWADPHGAFTRSTEQCVLCHLPHTSPAESLLLAKPDEKRLCYFCHDGTQSMYDAQSEFGESVIGSSTARSHHPVPEGTLACGDCHTPHSGPAEGNAMALSVGPSQVSTGTAFCGSCHGAETTLPQGDKLTLFSGTAHETSMPAVASGSGIACAACHAPHGSDNVALIRPVIRSLGGTTRTVSATATAAALCLGCHDVADGGYLGPVAYLLTRHSSVTTSTKALVSYPASGKPSGDCGNCHDPHGTGQPKMTRQSGDALCYTCHDDASTVKPATYSYQGRDTFLVSAHGSITSTSMPGQLTLTSSSDGFAAWESTEMPTPSSPGTPMPAEKLQRLGSLDSSRAVTSLADATGQHDFQTYRFKVPGNASGSGARFVWNGYGESFAGYETSVSVWSNSVDAGSGGWARIANGSFANQTLVATSFPDLADHVDASGYLWVMADTRNIVQSEIVSGPTITSATATQAVVTWTTAGYADSWVEFGTTTLYGSFAASGVRTMTHSITLPLLGAGQYHLRVGGTAQDGDSSVSADLPFRNVVPTPVPVPDLSGTQQSFAVPFSWDFDISSGGPYTYDLHIWSANTGYDQTLTGLESTSTTVTLPCNYSSTSTYNWQVRARDVDGYVSSWSSTDVFQLIDNTYVPGGSCPFIYTWDGTRFVFGADLNTTGKLGEKTANGYSAPDPTDRYVLPTEPALKDGEYELRLVEERHEVDYTDRFKLFAVDLPDGVDIAAKKGERGRIGPYPPGGLHTIADARTPRTVRTDTGEDVTSLVSNTDDLEVQLNEDRDFFDYKTLELDLGDVSEAPQVKIVMNAHTARPLTPEGIARQRTFGATTKLEVQDVSGAWRSVPTSEASLPNAMEFARTYVFDIRKAMHDTTGKVRFTYLFKTWIDSIAVDTSADQAITLTELPLRSATLGYHGIDPHDRPGESYEYVYSEEAGQSYDFLPGDYTRYGDVTPLLAATDDEFVVYGPGDELVMRFAPPAPAKAGTHREFLTYSDSYYKGDKSAVTQTVDPLPFRAMSNYPYGADEHYPDDAEHQEYLTTWNTRSSDEPTAQPASAPQSGTVSILGGLWETVRSAVARLGEALGLIAAVPVTSADPETLHRSLNTDYLVLEVTAPTSQAKTGCSVCHGVHGGAQAWDGSTPSGALLSATGRLCTGDGAGGCHSSSAASVSGVNVYAGVTASSDDRAHHDLTSAQQQRTGMRTSCADCHNPHTETSTARYSDPAAPAASVTTSLGPYVDASGTVYALVSAMHDGTPPTISDLAISGGSQAATVLTPTVTWTTNEPATTWVDWGTSSGSYGSSAGTDAVSPAHTVTLTGLALDQTYYWRIRTADAVGNVSTSAEGTYSTNLPGPAFTSGPTLTGNGWSDWATPTVDWTTSDAVTTILEWGTSSGVYTSSSVDPARTTAHSETMSELATDTVYYWRVTGSDALGRALSSAEATYLASPPPVPTVTLGPLVAGDTWSTHTTPTVIWNTSDLSSSWVEWGTSSGVYTSFAGSDSQVTTHTAQMSGLSVGTTYYLKAFGFDPMGRLVASLETTYVPEVPPVPTITSGPFIASTGYLDQSSPTVSWTTSDLTSSWVDWGTVPGSYTASAGTDPQSLSHSVAINGLSYGTTYCYRVRGLDPGGREVVSSESTYEVTPYPESFTATGPASAAYDSGFGQYSVSVSLWTSGTTILNGHPLEYRLFVDGAPASTWSTATTWTVDMVGTPTGQVHPYFAVARDQLEPSRTTTSAVSNITIVDYATYVGSCPFVYTWDGTRFVFGADLNTTGKLGEKTAAGFSVPDPTDRYVLPTVPALKDGSYELRLVEERREVDYTDEFKLFAVDLPDGVEMAAEKGQRGGIGPLPPGGLHTLAATRTPRSVRTDTGEDVTSLVAATDDRFVQLNEDRNVFDYKTLELDLGDVSEAPQVKIVMNASTARPVTAEGIARQRTFGATTKLEVQDAAGAWRSVPASEASLPNAMEFARTYVFDITKAMHDTSGKVRFTYLFKTWVDSIAVDTSADQTITPAEVPLRSATLGYHGIDPRDDPGEKYDYVYSDSPKAHTDFLPGDYTKYGDVTPLLTKTDDEFVVYGPGDELVLRFAPLPPPASGTHREFLTYSDSYYKGAKSAVTQTVDPLPFRAMSNYPYGADEHYPDDAEYQEYLSAWNTRSGAASGPTASSAEVTTTSALPAFLSRHGRAALSSSAWTATASDPVLPTHYSVNTDLAVVGVTYYSDALTTLVPAEAWASAAGTPTPSTPGDPVAGSELAKAGSRDGTYWSTDLAVSEGAFNHQLMRFSLPSSPETSAVKSFAFTWTGYGEPTASHPTTVYLWNTVTSAWDPISAGTFGTDTTVKSTVDDSQSTFCVRCHTSAPPPGITMPAGLPNLASIWTTTAASGDRHGDRGGTGFGGTLEPGLSRGSKAIPCMTCHDAHGNGNLYHLESTINGKTGISVSTGAQTESACTACHAGNADVWHSSCNDCHFDPEMHEWAPSIGSGADCLACHKHGAVWNHPPSCHCGPWPSSFKTF